MANLRILHLSDLHIASEYRFFRKTIGMAAYDRDALSAVAETAYMLREEFDAILISGDIADIGQDIDLKPAVDFLDLPIDSTSKSPWLYGRKPTLKACGKPIILVPGNHDRFTTILGMPGSMFDYFFSSYWKVGFGGVQTYFLPDDETPILAIICTDFSLAGVKDSTVLTGHWGQGKVYKDRLTALRQQTEAIMHSKHSPAIIWMIHFAPKFEEHDHLEENLKLIDADDFIQLATELGVKHIFCGHTHRKKSYSTKNIWVHCAGTATCIDHDYDTSIHVYDIAIEKGKIVAIKNINLAYDSESQTFQVE